ncbi:hypothetical protein AA12717_3718 [Gluconacetobacter sacchari DSM 12717]|uniref:Uncharacterized protein n=1 Tax=Gluconacetobacter sacchari DSM 12717 TaxID=1307940 RepID=A0ABQ0PC70_9PROT|nr:hypothetical protein AA12717_3718 [Gluconacetobacter sacchari DSM 12717]
MPDVGNAPVHLLALEHATELAFYDGAWMASGCSQHGTKIGMLGARGGGYGDSLKGALKAARECPAAAGAGR